MEVVPSLVDICVTAASQNNHVHLQRRKLERLPDHCSNALLANLLHQGRLGPPQLESFRYSATRVSLPPGVANAEWVAYLSEFAHLEEAQLTGSSRLRDRDVGALCGGQAARGLRALDLSQCNQLSARCLEHLSCLTALRQLTLVEAPLKGAPSLHALPPLLTHLDLGGVASVDDACCSHLARLRHLRVLRLWGTGISSSTMYRLAGSTALEVLDVAWTGVDVLPALASLKELNMQHCMLQDVWWPAEQHQQHHHHNHHHRHDHQHHQLQLTVLNLSQCTFGSAAAAAAVQALLSAASPSLTSLSLAGCDLGGDGPVKPGRVTSVASPGLLEALLGATSLQKCDLSGCTGVTAQGVACLTGSGASLTHLSLGGGARHVDAAVVAELVLAGLHRLEALDLSGTAVDDAAVPLLQQLSPSLRHLNLNSTAVTLASSGHEGGNPDDGGLGGAWQGGQQGEEGGEQQQGGDAERGHGIENHPDDENDYLGDQDQHHDHHGDRDGGEAEAPAAPHGGRGASDDAQLTGRAWQEGSTQAAADSPWQRLHQLQTLCLLSTQVTDAGVAALCAGLSRCLTRLQLGSPAIHDAALRPLSQLQRLQQLDLEGCKQVTGTGVRHLAHAPSLRQLSALECWLVPHAALARLLQRSRTILAVRDENGVTTKDSSVPDHSIGASIRGSRLLQQQQGGALSRDAGTSVNGSSSSSRGHSGAVGDDVFSWCLLDAGFRETIGSGSSGASGAAAAAMGRALGASGGSAGGIKGAGGSSSSKKGARRGSGEAKAEAAAAAAAMAIHDERFRYTSCQLIALQQSPWVGLDHGGQSLGEAVQQLLPPELRRSW